MTHFILVLLLQIYLLEYPSEYIKDNLPNYLGFIIIITLLIAFFFISYYLTTVALTIKIEWEEVIIYKKSGLFYYRTKIFKINEVEYYLLTYDPKYATLKLQIKDKPVIKILKIDLFTDDFEKFKDRLIRLMESTKNGEEPYNKRVPILAETTSGLWVSIILGLLLLLLIVFGKGAGRFVMLPGIGFFIFQVISFRKNRMKSTGRSHPHNE